METCSTCGEELEPGAESCWACGAAGGAPTWPLAGLVVCWVAWIVAVPAALSGNPLGVIAGLAVLASLVLLYLDASVANDAGELEIDYPILVPVAVLLLWALTLPAYVVYRFATR